MGAGGVTAAAESSKLESLTSAIVLTKVHKHTSIPEIMQ